MHSEGIAMYMPGLYKSSNVLGMPNCIAVVQAKEAGRVLAAEMKSADLDSDGRIDFREFIMYFERLARWRAQQARAGRLNARQNSAVPPGKSLPSSPNRSHVCKDPVPLSITMCHESASTWSNLCQYVSL